MLNIVVTGAAGKMGKTNIQVVNSSAKAKLTGAVAKLVGAVEAPGVPFVGMDAGELAGIGRIGVPVVDDIRKVEAAADAVIDFSSPSSLPVTVEWALSRNAALVVGTTGLSDADKKLLKETSLKLPVIHTPNFSVGVALIAKLTRIAAGVLNEGFDAEIVEAHHRMKKDSPSGTAIKLLDVLKDVYKTGDIVYGREGMVGARREREIGVLAVRGGDVVGDHTVHFLGDGERVEITHRATSRETFARGALRAAFFIVEKGKGLYTMEDVLGF
jgi:4-hydroxy-tetrahydrodipicolinate reductase